LPTTRSGWAAFAAISVIGERRGVRREDRGRRDDLFPLGEDRVLDGHFSRTASIVMSQVSKPA